MKRPFLNISRASKIMIGILSALVALGGVWELVINSYNKKSIDGKWYFTFKTNSGIAETHTQKVFFIQNDEEIIGQGEKWEYNGELLPFDMHGKLEYAGTLDGSDLKATYKLFGLLKESYGNIVLRLSNDGKFLTGKFFGTGNSQGVVIGEKRD